MVTSGLMTSTVWGWSALKEEKKEDMLAGGTGDTRVQRGPLPSASPVRAPRIDSVKDVITDRCNRRSMRSYPVFIQRLSAARRGLRGRITST